MRGASSVMLGLLVALSVPPAAAEVAWGTTASAASGSRAEMFGVAAASQADVWAVGGFNPGLPPTAVLTQLYAEHWDGSRWTATPVPLAPTYATQGARLSAAAAIGPGAAWAVGHVDDLGSLASQTLAYRWDGANWIAVPTPNPGGAKRGNHLHAVASRAAGDAWAVGDSGYPARSLVLQWNGSAWAVAKAPNIGSLVAVTIDKMGVWAASATRVMQFDGSSWKTLPPPPPPASEGALQLAGIARGDGRLWVVGTQLIPYFEGYLYRPYAAYWQQAQWTVVSSIAAGSGLSAVVARGAMVRASSSEGGIFNLDVGGARREVTPAPGPVQLNAITADRTGLAWSVGTRYDSGTPAPAIYNAPGIGQGGIRVTTGYGGALVTWIGPVIGTGSADLSGQFSVGGLPLGSYQVISNGAGCSPGISSATVGEGTVTSLAALVQC